MESEAKLENAVWITWERQTRNRSASHYLGVPLHEIIVKSNIKAVRYIKSATKTVMLILNRRPSYLFVQNPSVVLAVIGLLASKLCKIALIVDAHNAGVFFEGKFHRIVNYFNRLVIRRANLVIITNAEVAKTIQAIGGRPLIMPDPLPDFPILGPRTFPAPCKRTTDKLSAFCITSWGLDEPVEELINAASEFSETIDFYFTGNFRKAKFKLMPDTEFKNIKLLGFVSEKAYFSLLVESDFAIDLTTRQDCMVCGAYESVSADKPILLSDTPPQKEYFSKGAVFTKTNSAEISNALHEMKKNLPNLQNEIRELHTEIKEREKARRFEIIKTIMYLE